jgi:drug/metabolite transporter (DMT)-like permease
LGTFRLAHHTSVIIKRTTDNGLKRDLLFAYIALGAICIIWGTTYLALRIGVLHFPAFLFVVLRQLISGSLLAVIMLTIGKVSWPSRDNIIRQAIAGFFMITMGNGLVAYAEILIPSGVAAIICSLMPMMVILINLTVNREEKPTIPIVLGVMVGLVGYHHDLWSAHRRILKLQYQVGIVLIFLAIVCWAGCSVWLKKKSEGNLFLNASLQMFFGVCGQYLSPCLLTILLSSAGPLKQCTRSLT